MRFDPVDGFSFAALMPWESSVTSRVVQQLGFQRRVVIAPKGKAGTEIDAFKWLNVLIGNLKTTLSGTHHAFKFSKYAARDLAEVQYRFNRRADLCALIPRLLKALMQAKPCPRGVFQASIEQET